MTAGPELLGSYWTLAGDADPNAADPWSPWDFAERVEAAADVGFTGIGLLYQDLEHVRETYTFDEMNEVLDANGIEHVELENLNDWFLDPDDDRRRRSDRVRSTLLAAASALDARHIKVCNIPRRSRPVAQVADAFEQLCAEAREYDTRVGLEYMYEDGNFDSLRDALDLIADVDAPNGGILLDAWHVLKSGTDHDVLRSIPPEDLLWVELNDGHRQSPFDRTEETTNHRLLPGEGELDVTGFASAVSAAGYDAPWGVEVINAELRRRPMAETYSRSYEAAMSVLGESD